MPFCLSSMTAESAPWFFGTSGKDSVGWTKATGKKAVNDSNPVQARPDCFRGRRTNTRVSSPYADPTGKK